MPPLLRLIVSTDDPSELEERVRELAEHALGAPVARVEPLTAQLGLRRFFRVAIEASPVRSLVARVDLPYRPPRSFADPGWSWQGSGASQAPLILYRIMGE